MGICGISESGLAIFGEPGLHPLGGSNITGFMTTS